jgi:alanyl-tRNA synthetase
MQKGSLVGPDRLRFDFTHDAPLGEEEIERIEDLVNTWIEANVAAHSRFTTYADALESGAIAIFEEKYGDEVRVISFGEFSTELCGGTHAGATGDVGILKILSESGIASGVRRIEALTGLAALAHVRRQERTLRAVASLLRSPVDEVPARVERLLGERRAAEQQIEKLLADRRSAVSQGLSNAAREVAGVRVVATRVPGAAAKDLRSMVDALREKLKSGVVLLASESDEQVALALGVTPDLTKRFPAGRLVREVASVIGGKGGGRPDFAQAGGKYASKLDAAFEKLEALLAEG